MILVLARRELWERYGTSRGWLALAAAQLLLAWLLFTQLDIYLKIQPRLTSLASPLGVADLVIAPTLASAALVLLGLAPLLGMGSIADEVRSGRLSLLLSSPLRASSLVAGKWLGLFLALLPAVLLSMGMAAALGLATHPDPGRLAASALGLGLVAALAAAVTLWLSSLVEQPATAAGLAWGALFLLWFVDNGGNQALALFSLRSHLQPFLEGRVGAGALLWFAILTVAPLTLATLRLWRLGGGR